MRFGPFLGLAPAAAVVGCADSGARLPTHDKADESGGQTAGTSQADLLGPLAAAEKPDGAISVKKALKRKEGETVVVTGRTPPDNVKPFNSAVAAFILMDPDDLEKEDIKEELECEDAANCPSCRKLLDTFGVRVELVDQTGAVLPATAEGFRGLKPGSTVTVVGEVKRDGKDKKTVRIVAKQFYTG